MLAPNCPDSQLLNLNQGLQDRRPVEQFKTDMRDYINKTKLSRFFPPGNRFLEKVVEKAVELDENPNNTLDVRDLTRLALYQPVLYCGTFRQHVVPSILSNLVSAWLTDSDKR